MVRGFGINLTYIIPLNQTLIKFKFRRTLFTRNLTIDLQIFAHFLTASSHHSTKKILLFVAISIKEKITADVAEQKRERTKKFPRILLLINHQSVIHFSLCTVLGLLLLLPLRDAVKKENFQLNIFLFEEFSF